MKEKVARFIKDFCEVSPPQRILIGVSGGPDSLSMLDILHRSGFEVEVAHLDHGMRASSAEDVVFVERLARSMGLVFHSEQVMVPEVAAREGLSLEEAARKCRYQYLFRVAREIDAQAVAVGHQANDQVETVLMHFLRGAALSGLKGMTPRAIMPSFDPQIPLIRPMLAVWRSEIEAYCAGRGLSPLSDASNLDQRFHRNRLRHELIPFLETYNPNLQEVVWRNSRVLAAEYDLVQEVLDQAWRQVVEKTGDDFLMFSQPQFKAYQQGIRWGLLRRGITALRPESRDILLDTVLRLDEFCLRQDPEGRVDVQSGLILFREAGSIILAGPQAGFPEEWLQLAAGQKLWVDIPGWVDLPGNWVFSAEIEELQQALDPGDLLQQDPFEILVDGSTIGRSLEIRARLPGDRFSPLGLAAGSQKVSDFMINEKIPRRARSGWPLVLSDEQIIWIPGYRMTEQVRIRTETTLFVRLRLKQKSAGSG